MNEQIPQSCSEIQISQLTSENAELKESLACELKENLELFDLVGLKTKEDFGHLTATKVLREKIELILKENAELKAKLEQATRSESEDEK